MVDIDQFCVWLLLCRLPPRDNPSGEVCKLSSVQSLILVPVLFSQSNIL